MYNKPVKNAFIALIIHIISCFILLIPFKLHIYGIVYAMIIFAFALYVLNQIDINKVIRYRNSAMRYRYILTYSLMIVSSAIMGAVVFFLNKLLVDRIFTEETMFFMILRLIICIPYSRLIKVK